MLPSQSPHPATHVPVQVPAVQAWFVTWFEEQTTHAPPPAPHDEGDGVMHEPPAQQPAGHDVASHTQEPPTHRWPAPHAGREPHWQTPPEHESAPGPQTLPQELQLFGSVTVFDSQPFEAMLPSQLPHPASQVPVQVPAVQALFVT